MPRWEEPMPQGHTPQNVIDIEPKPEPPKVTTTEVAVRNETELQKTIASLSLSDDKEVTLDSKDAGDQRIALAREASSLGSVIDITRLAGSLQLNFCVGPARLSGKVVSRRRNVATSEAYYYVGRSYKRNAWHMHFERGLLSEGDRYSTSTDWRTASLHIPYVPVEHRGHPSALVVWEQNWSSSVLGATSPVLLDHVAGDVYRLVAGWEISDLEAAAMRGKRT